jgi:hypothetical protein
MITALDLIKVALRQINALATGEQPTADEAQDSLAALNRMLGSWNNNGLIPYTTAINTYPLALAQTSYTLGAGGNLSGVRPQRIEQANVVLQSGLREPLRLLNDEEWSQIKLQSVGSAIPRQMYADGGYPLRRLYFYPYPNAPCSLELYTWQALDKFAALTSAVVLPDGYEEAIITNLAKRLAPEFGTQVSAGVAQLAAESLMAIESLNAPTPQMTVDSAIFSTGARSWNWMTGETR